MYITNFEKVIDTLTKHSKSHRGGFKLILEDLGGELTDRQLVIVKLKADGYKNLEIADSLGVCPATITNEIKKIKPIIKKYLRS